MPFSPKVVVPLSEQEKKSLHDILLRICMAKVDKTMQKSAKEKDRRMLLKS